MALTVEGMCPLLQVFDMPTALSFYRDILGFAVVHAAPSGDDCDWCLLRRGSVELMLNTQYERPDRPAAADPARTVGHGDVTFFFGCRDPDAAYAYLLSKGVLAEPPVDQAYGMRQVYFRDPDGYSLCLQWPSADASSA